jgi:hypothetical protein
MKIFKFRLEPELRQKIKMPYDCVIRSAGVQGDEIFVWAEVDERNELFDYIFYVVPTGVEVSDFDLEGMRFLDTVIMKMSTHDLVLAYDLVFHVYCIDDLI